MVRLLLTFVLGLSLYLPGNVANAQEPEMVLASSQDELDLVALRAKEAAVKVLTPNGHGSGTYCVWKGHTFVLTAAHVVAGEDFVLIRKNGIDYPAAVIMIDQKSDMAMVDVELDIRPVQFRPKKDIALIGSEITVVGSPSHYDELVIKGEVAGYEQDGGEVYIICHSFAWPGMSGAAVFDQWGHIIGIVNAVGVGRVGAGIQLIDDIVWVHPVTVDSEQLKKIFQKRW